MKLSDSPSSPLPHHDPLPQHNYELALKSAVSWLGDRYLLAAPLPKRKAEPEGYFIENRRWHEGVRRRASP